MFRKPLIPPLNFKSILEAAAEENKVEEKKEEASLPVDVSSKLPSAAQPKPQLTEEQLIKKIKLLAYILQVITKINSFGYLSFNKQLAALRDYIPEIKVKKVTDIAGEKGDLKKLFKELKTRFIELDEINNNEFVIRDPNQLVKERKGDPEHVFRIVTCTNEEITQIMRCGVASFIMKSLFERFELLAANRLVEIEPQRRSVNEDYQSRFETYKNTLYKLTSSKHKKGLFSKKYKQLDPAIKKAEKKKNKELKLPKITKSYIRKP